jgi:hypothetical protein
MCARHSLLPKSLQFELPGGKTGDVRHYGGYADVLKRGCGEREVAIKALRARDPKLEALTNVSQHWSDVMHAHVNVLTVRFVEVLQGGYSLEISSASQHIAAPRGDND